MRKSTAYSIRPSHAGSLSSQASSAQHAAKLVEKKKEHDALLVLEHLSAEYARRLDAIDFDCNIMANAGKVHGEVLAQWPEMFRILSLSVPRAAPQAQSETDAQETEHQSCERLVRIPLDELQKQENAKL
ncbi:hypothetical protein EW145_g5159 [Phellinidium pouzarii]|uniref:DASH complex subunit DAD2 n=1 Tax=Phellinidium pouzarii TaxID=167371 RepID=A0A4S4L2V4_9AGAM|nr:hypothetical protein EW145_g5159 [Phellinidium pouzarii]